MSPRVDVNRNMGRLAKRGDGQNSKASDALSCSRRPRTVGRTPKRGDSPTTKPSERLVAQHGSLKSLRACLDPRKCRKPQPWKLQAVSDVEIEGSQAKDIGAGASGRVQA